ncbi:MAG: ATP/GTP-binding protein [Chloroflexota bacterium]|jgi:hypothetical protein
MLKTVRIRNFRGFADLTLDGLERVNLLAGTNGAGKTAVLEALFLHVGAHNPELGMRVNIFRGLTAFKAELDDLFAPLFHQYALDPAVEITSKDEQGIERSLTIRLAESSLAALGPSNGNDRPDSLSTAISPREVRFEYADSEGKRTISNGWLTAEGLRVQAGKPWGGQALFLATRYHSPAEDAQRFSELAVQLRQQPLVETLKLIEPRLSSLSVQAMGNMALIYGDIGLGRLIPIDLMGQGTSRLLSIMLAIVSQQASIVLIDEVENGLHYSVMSKVWRAIAQAARASDVQVFATTHSWECICAAHEAFTSDSLYDFRLHRLEWANGDIRAVSLDQEMLDTAIKAGLEVR